MEFTLYRSEWNRIVEKLEREVREGEKYVKDCCYASDVEERKALLKNKKGLLEELKKALEEGEVIK